MKQGLTVQKIDALKPSEINERMGEMDDWLKQLDGVIIPDDDEYDEEEFADIIADIDALDNKPLELPEVPTEPVKKVEKEKKAEKETWKSFNVSRYFINIF